MLSMFYIQGEEIMLQELLLGRSGFLVLVSVILTWTHKESAFPICLGAIKILKMKLGF